jgi:hypothetical protein
MKNQPMTAWRPAWMRWLLLWLALAGTSGVSLAAGSVAVLDFQVEHPTQAASERAVGLEDYFELALQKQDVPVLERRNIRLVLAERSLQANGLLSLETLSQAKLPAVDYFVSGTVNFVGIREFILTLSIIRSDKATVEFTLTRQGAYPDGWLPAMESLAGEIHQRLQLPPLRPAERSEFEMITWLPEAALPFFKGLDYYSRGDYAMAVPQFQSSYAKDQHFNLARRWEARAYRKLNLLPLAETLSGAETNNHRVSVDLQRPVVAVVAGEKISAAGRAAFMEALAHTDRFELFEPASIGTTAREIDLQLTGQMAAPPTDRSVWLVVDDLIYLDAPDSQTLVVREQNLLSGEVLRQAKIRAANTDENGCAALAKAFLDCKPESPAQNVGTVRPDQPDLPEPTRQDSPESAFAAVLRLAAAHPQSARLWIGLADFYPNETRKMLLEQAVSAIATNRQSPDASFWLASALWREREMSRRIFYRPTATRLAPNPMTNDFARLLQWFPNSDEARNLIEVTNHGEGSYIYTEIKDRRYLDSVFDYGSRLRPPPAPTPSKTEPVIQTSQPVRTVTDEERLVRLNNYLKQNRPAPAWSLANSLRGSKDPAIQLPAGMIHSNLLQAIVRERDQFKEFTAAAAAQPSAHSLELGRALLNCVDRRQRVEVIEKCGEVIKKQEGIPGQLGFLFNEAKQYRNDFLLDPADPAREVPANDIEYQVLENSTLIQPVIYGKDYGYEPLMGKVAEMAHALPSSDLTRNILEYIREDRSLPLEKRLTAAYDLAMLEQAEGRNFEALELLKDVLRQAEGTGLPLVRSDHWSESIAGAAFNALRKLRIYAEPGEDICDSCGKVPAEPPTRPANFEEVNRKLGQLWQQQIGELGTNLPPIKQQLLADQKNFFPVMLYKLRTGQEVSHTLIFCGDLGTNALPALPVIMQIIHHGEPFQDYNNALSALGALGKAAGCAKPLLILARENADNGNFHYALQRIGPAPRRVMPQLAALLYHKNPEICRLAAGAMVETAGLDRQPFKGTNGEQQVTMVRQWWEATGIQQTWSSETQPPSPARPL